MSSNHMHQWIEEALVGRRTCQVCGMVVTFDHREDIAPTRIDVDIAGLNDPIIHAAMTLYRRGDCSYEDALRIAVVALSGQVHHLLEQEIARRMRQP